MKSKSKIRFTLIAILMVFATAAIGLQPLVFSLGSGCACDAGFAVDANILIASCCGDLVEEQQQTSCCSSRQATMARKCCCNPEASVCECGDCGCSKGNDSRSSLPAMPTSETTEVVTPNLICAAPFVGYPRDSEIKRVDYSDTVAEHTALSSQQTCVLLSRFTC